MKKRVANYPVLDLLIRRWSPRAMSGEVVSFAELMSLIEAARWAPSSFNNQPWRFIYGMRGTPEWDHLFALLVPSNQVWAKNAGILLLACSHRLFDYDKRYSRTHSLDTGASTMSIALQGYSMGLVVHGMEGFDYDTGRVALNIPQEYDVEAMYAIGKPGPISELPAQLQEREFPSERKETDTLIFHGTFGKPAENER